MSDTVGSGPEPPEERAEAARRGSTALWTGALLLVGAATAALVLSDDPRLLRLGLVAALWAALAGAFVAARLRSQVVRAQERAQDDQRLYESELEREIAAREEHAAEVRADAYRQAADESAAQIQALQSEMQRLRATLEKVVGGDVLFEHVALRAESTRVRSLDQSGGSVFGGFGQAGIEQAGVQQAGVQQAFRAAEYPAAQRPGMRPPEPAPQPPASQPPAPAAGARSSGDGADPVAETALIAPAVGTGSVRAAGTIEEAAAEDPGAHTAGTSVEDLLAAYGSTGDAQRRRRRRA
ncbi:hypothetical protein IQ251_06720 [Saccharopolyspora sp. HNM0983]|uniref:DUF6779 domain-containing protein n=1 Tax=Saccharopolyspora montiporae TaxID=2781240 RepID=A0A929FZ89_9PSEU|nr:DUF6779 domain-containing protein [Saccharopolyspora sp. HNM0983]MBE9374139.1 hypothetical protein [Saccharopolyspora sp. HNM0983]